MPEPKPSRNLPTASYNFGYEVMGPILAECCHLLHDHLVSTIKDDNSRVLFCARGGLIIRRALEFYLKRIKQTLPSISEDFMVSRLAASRLALITCPERIAPLLALEFEGRSCAEVASVLSNEDVPNEGTWELPYTLDRLFDLLSRNKEGKRLHDAIFQQADLLRNHFFFLSSGVNTVHIVDTGVFGSIGYFLELGLPRVSTQSVLLFRANYKKMEGLQLPLNTGLVCNEDQYCPWKPRTVSRLYWPFIESFFEPELPSVRTYRLESTGEILSNLQVPNWRDRLLPVPGSIRAGAFAYLASLKPASVSSIPKHSSDAWQQLRRLIVYPRQGDLALLGVTARGVDFGFDDIVSFGESTLSRSLLAKIARVRASIWPEGEMRRLFPRTAWVWLRILETNRTLTAITRAMKP